MTVKIVYGLILLGIVQESALSLMVLNTYTAAVLEHARIGDHTKDSLENIVQKNLEVYATATKAASKRGADIIVFPDFGLFPKLKSRKDNLEILEAIPSPDMSNPPHPCEQPVEFHDKPILTSLSCLAQEYHIVIVAQTGGIENCSKEEDTSCPEDGAYHFNTQIAFGRNGSLLSRYYKEHLFYEDAYDLYPEPQNSCFSTDFGNFCMFSAFDILFNNSVAMMEQDMMNAAYSTLWFDELPLFTSVQVQEMFAVKLGVNLLAANLNIPKRAAVGSGIYSGASGALKYTHNPDGLSKLIIVDLPLVPGTPISNDNASIFLVRDKKIIEYDEHNHTLPEFCQQSSAAPEGDAYKCNERDLSPFTLRKLIKSEDSFEVCSDTLCCSLDYQILGESLEEDYFLAVYEGDLTIAKRYHFNTEICILVRCDPDEDGLCQTYPLKSRTVFKRLKMKANFTTNYVFPSIVYSEQELATAINFSYDNKGTLNFHNSTKPLLVASLFGRRYHKDPPYKS